MRLVFISLTMALLCGCRAPAPQKSAPPRKAATPQVRQKQLFVVIDDAGLTVEETQQYLDLPIPITIAVLPHLKRTREVCAAISRYADKEIILHQPMEAYDASQDLGAGAILNSTRPADVAAILAGNLASVRGARGVNNHMGSRVTENPELVQAVLRYCKANGLFFLDSKTAYNSQVPLMARHEHMHMEARDVFLDIQKDREYIRKMWGQAVGKARTQGYAIVIGHAWSTETAAALRDSYQTLENQGYTFHLLSELYD
jgi:polysaccharide deacetylase 2 family uncharacterized protein YibQ